MKTSTNCVLPRFRRIFSLFFDVFFFFYFFVATDENQLLEVNNSNESNIADVIIGMRRTILTVFLYLEI